MIIAIVAPRFRTAHSWAGRRKTANGDGQRDLGAWEDPEHRPPVSKCGSDKATRHDLTGVPSKQALASFPPGGLSKPEPGPGPGREEACFVCLWGPGQCSTQAAVIDDSALHGTGPLGHWR